MKILFVTDLYPISPSEKNTAKTLHNFVTEWIRSGNEIDVIKPNFIFNSFIRRKPFYKSGFYKYDGVKIFNVNFHTPFLFDVEKKLPKEFVIQDYDYIVAHMPSGIIFADKLAQKYSKPLVCGLHNSDMTVLTSPLYTIYFKQKLKRALLNSKKIACRSWMLEKRITEKFPEFESKTFVAPSGVSIPSELTANYNVPKTILTCANLISRKNIDKLVLAMKDFPDYKLSIVGDGVELKKLKNLAKTMGNIDFLGCLPQNEVFNEMKASDIFILPSVGETFGMVYLEAMACGCITVCTDNDGVAGLIRDGENGFLTVPDADGISKVIDRIKNHKSLEEIRKNAYDAVSKLAPGACAQNYLDQILN